MNTTHDQYRAACRLEQQRCTELAAKSLDNPGLQLAYLVLADYCLYEGSDERGGPSMEEVQLAEKITGICLDKWLEGSADNRHA